jgi:hypothetical protein
MRWALLWLLAACGEAPQASKSTCGIAFEPALVEAVGVEQLEHGVDLLAAALGWRAGVALCGRDLSVTTAPEVWVRGERAHGFYQPAPLGGHVTVAWRPGQCAGETALLWELAHVVVCMDGCDDDYVRPEWHRVSEAMAAWRAEVCGQPYRPENVQVERPGLGCDTRTSR